MAWRAIQDNLGRSVSLASVSANAERLFIRLLAHSNPYGRLDGHPLKVRALCFPLLPLSNEDAGRALIELVEVKRIVAYEDNGEAYIAITDFDENQPKEAYKRRGESKIPPAPEPVDNPVEKQAGLLGKLWRLPNTPELVGSCPTEEIPAQEHDSRSGRKLSGGDEKETETREEEINPKAVTSTYPVEPEHDETNGPGLEEIDQLTDSIAGAWRDL